VRTDWPSGEQTVFVFVQRFFRTTQRDGSQTAEPAGSAQGQMCLFCDIEVWNRVREVLGTRVEG
jgi:hypothetical protein